MYLSGYCCLSRIQSLIQWIIQTSSVILFSSQVIEDVDYLRRLANAINSIGIELEETILTVTSADWNRLYDKRLQTDTDVNNLNDDFRHSIFSFGTLLKTKSRLKQALTQIRYRTEKKRTTMSMTIQEFTILMEFLTDNLILSINGISYMENPNTLVKFQMSQMATTALHIVSAYWMASCQNDSFFTSNCEVSKTSNENIISYVNTFIGVTESFFMRDNFPRLTKGDKHFLRQIRHLASHFVFDGLQQGHIEITSECCSQNVSQSLKDRIVRSSISTIEKVKLETKVNCDAFSEILGLNICGLLLSVGLFIVVSFLYHCQLRRVSDLDRKSVV